MNYLDRLCDISELVNGPCCQNRQQSVIMATLGFTPASGHDRFSIETAQQSSSTITRTLSGEEARKFYENLMTDNEVQNVSSSAVSQNKQRSRRRRRAVRAAGMQQGRTDSVAQRRIGDEGEGHQRGEPSGSERSIELLGLRLLRCAQEGDISGLKDLLSKGVDINFQVQT